MIILLSLLVALVGVLIFGRFRHRIEFRGWRRGGKDETHLDLRAVAPAMLKVIP